MSQNTESNHIFDPINDLHNVYMFIEETKQHQINLKRILFELNLANKKAMALTAKRKIVL